MMISNVKAKCDSFMAKIVENIVSTTEGRINRLLLGACLYPVLFGTVRYLHNANVFQLQMGNIVCPEELKQLNMIQKIFASTYMMASIEIMVVMEEVFFRIIVQNIALKEKVTSLLDRVSVNLSAWYKGLAGKVVRVILVTSLFSLLHMPQYFFNGELMTKGWDHAIKVVPLGLFGAIAHEINSLGPVASAGLHLTNDFVALSYVNFYLFKKC